MVRPHLPTAKASDVLSVAAMRTAIVVSTLSQVYSRGTLHNLGMVECQECAIIAVTKLPG